MIVLRRERKIPVAVLKRTDFVLRTLPYKSINAP